MEPTLRSEILILFLSFLIGSAAGWWSRIHWSGAIPTVAATLVSKGGGPVSWLTGVEGALLEQALAVDIAEPATHRPLHREAYTETFLKECDRGADRKP